MRDARQREMKIIRIKAGLENLQIQFTEISSTVHMNNSVTCKKNTKYL